MTVERPAEEQRLLQRALDAFLAYGFHTVKPVELEAATGLSWDELCDRFGDKEALFLAAVEFALSTGVGIDVERHPDMREMVDRLERANRSPRLRAIHRSSLGKLRSLQDSQPPEPPA